MSDGGTKPAEPSETELPDNESGDEDVEDEQTEHALWLSDAPADDPPDASVIELEPPNVRNARFGLPEKLWRTYRYRKKRRKLTTNGYVQWYLIDDAWPNPKFVKPEYKGEGQREYEYKDCLYIFPREAMLPAEEQGMWTVIHKKGEMDPINLRDPSATSINADSVSAFLDMKATADPPSFFDKFDLDAGSAIKWMIVGLAGVMIVQSLL